MLVGGKNKKKTLIHILIHNTPNSPKNENGSITDRRRLFLFLFLPSRTFKVRIGTYNLLDRLLQQGFTLVSPLFHRGAGVVVVFVVVVVVSSFFFFFFCRATSLLASLSVLFGATAAADALPADRGCRCRCRLRLLLAARRLRRPASLP